MSNNITSEDSAFMTNGKFDVNKFNDSFVGMIDKNKQINNELDQKTLAELNNQSVNKHIYQSTLAELFSGIKTTWFALINDLLQFNFTYDVFTKNNRLFFIGLTFIIIGIILYFYNFFLRDEDMENRPPIEKIIEIHHVYDKQT